MNELPGLLTGQTPEDIAKNPMVYKPYADTYFRLIHRLIKGYPVPDDTSIAVLGNNTLKESKFRL